MTNFLKGKECCMTSLSEKNNDSFKSSEFKENLEILRQIFFFSGMPIEKLKVFAFICRRETFRDNEIIFTQGEDDGQGIFIVSGKANLVYDVPEGQEEIRTIIEGEFLGGISLLAEMRRHFSLKASGDVVCLVLKRDQFVSAMQQFPEVLPRIVKSMMERINDWEGRFLEFLGENRAECRHNLGVSIL